MLDSLYSQYHRSEGVGSMSWHLRTWAVDDRILYACSECDGLLADVPAQDTLFVAQTIGSVSWVSRKDDNHYASCLAVYPSNGNVLVNPDKCEGYVPLCQSLV
ncbi:hypothetical protein BC937DRAFT_93826 [Endogone sp. FLAS-F59071]|nr:hypothetical protein BC937DRAFT_93826 [Endogone sp. FLAS-F59071]|eukprot:RUS14437.1 hypothetical protein BC937DRAFT_93826 [Endogone sp. FLAS-F59071]